MTSRKSTEKNLANSEVKPVASFTEENINNDQVITTILSPDGKEVPVTGDVDEAMKLALHSHRELDEATDKRLLRKTDFYIMPLICFLYACQYMDKTTNSSASVMGLREDLHMRGDMYSWVGSSFYLGYLAFEAPVSMLLQRFPVAKTTAGFIIFWGVLMCLHATPNYAGFIFLRTALGIAESSVTPAMVIFTSQWYKAGEQFIRTAIWFSFNGLGTIMGNLIAYGLAVHAKSYNVTAWKILFIVVGLMTIVVGILFLILIPDSPATAWFLTEEEKMLMVERIRGNRQGFGNKHFKMYQLKEALSDINVWLFFVYALSGDIPNGSLTNFASLLLKGNFHYSGKKSLLMQTPGGAIELVGCSLFGLLHLLVPHRLAIAITAQGVTLAASCMLAFALQSNSARLAGYYLMQISPMGMICALSCFSSNTAGHTKKVVSSALYLIGYCVGNLIGPQTFISSQAPTYTGGQISIVVCHAVSMAILGWIYFNYYHENKKRQKKRERGETNGDIKNSEFADLTDKENVNFVYRL